MRAAQGRRGSPSREGSLGDCDRPSDLGGRRERNRRRLLTGGRIEARRGLADAAENGLSANVLGDDRGHWGLSPGGQATRSSASASVATAELICS